MAAASLRQRHVCPNLLGLTRRKVRWASGCFQSLAASVAARPRQHHRGCWPRGAAGARTRLVVYALAFALRTIYSSRRFGLRSRGNDRSGHRFLRRCWRRSSPPCVPCVAGVLVPACWMMRLLMVARNGAIGCPSYRPRLSGPRWLAFSINGLFACVRPRPIRALDAYPVRDRLLLHRASQGSLLYWALTLSRFWRVVVYQELRSAATDHGYDRRAYGIETFFLLILTWR